MQELQIPEVETLRALLDEAASAIVDVSHDPERKTWRAYDILYDAFLDIPARATMPLGELSNSALGFSPLAWDKQERLTICSWEQLAKHPRLTINAIEGMFSVEMDLIEALTLFDLIPLYRVSLSVQRSQVAPYLSRQVRVSQKRHFDSTPSQDELEWEDDPNEVIRIDTIVSAAL